MCEFAPARARREAQESRANRMLARPSCPAPMALVTFPERKVTRAVGRRGKDMDVGFIRRTARPVRQHGAPATDGLVAVRASKFCKADSGFCAGLRPTQPRN